MVDFDALLAAAADTTSATALPDRVDAVLGSVCDAEDEESLRRSLAGGGCERVAALIGAYVPNLPDDTRTDPRDRVALLRLAGACLVVSPGPVAGALCAVRLLPGPLAKCVSEPGMDAATVTLAAAVMESLARTVVPLPVHWQGALGSPFCARLVSMLDEPREGDEVNISCVALASALNIQFANSCALEANPLLVTVRDHPLRQLLGETFLAFFNRCERAQVTQCLMFIVCALSSEDENLRHLFFTNDLRTTIDVIIREVQDLPEEEVDLKIEYICAGQSVYEVLGEPHRGDEMLSLVQALEVSSPDYADALAETRRVIGSLTTSSSDQQQQQ